jgi:hypothetical protein
MCGGDKRVFVIGKLSVGMVLAISQDYAHKTVSNKHANNRLAIAVPSRQDDLQATFMPSRLAQPLQGSKTHSRGNQKQKPCQAASHSQPGFCKKHDLHNQKPTGK